ncbi:MAG: Tetratricopeptide repeat domain protein [Candidatus Magasanikbacteria bacterium GW2011_GWD2_43_18]|uniref:Tetratricopeptide repeat domain protein n=1 Tax=Candidatus Magasanikbacteria bacterium GW2011_GWE2_42_7 TaxID=1619052 RepID=A0A0G1BHR7_9BACT|nr:MAG: Tetratricopeptide repeat domain protein [Candidatus Magasanikbacteria bacterium GW2011_GWC2_42_27]KKS72882.1 MAG: Tetratricopeptide repeat domain protein [Candidatus Magasanikbacteria bacterium GW2011_GWE2_42_7]KKT05241.1 MAG: Tetratricopeptide repeat domain protein [Candidatus Magasanikbacteria bacterium GW2011_GWD2_43_18]KKT26137.1 MAG: Tetratricopeptide repeat domain protein [Candidatus Magasanikbacteria bacterium GW2011_GWA2_43_9]HBB37578.1 hypothetical protein [Candidatus Magasanik
MRISTYTKVMTWLTIASFCIPLLVLAQQFIFPFIVLKAVVFRSIVLLMLGVYILLLKNDWQTYKPRLSVVSLSVLFFLASWVISTFVGVDWYRSFWDGHERMLGTFTIIHYVLYFLILSSVFRTREAWQSLFPWFFGMGMGVLLIGFWQVVNPEFLLNRGSDRVSSTLGNPIYYGGYALFLFFLSTVLFLKGKERLHRWIYGAGVIISALAVLLSGTRGTLLALIGAVVLCLFLVMIFSRQASVRRYLAVGFVSLLILAGALFFVRETSFVKAIPGVGRLLNTSLSADSAETRVMAWGIAVEAWEEKPVFGWGPAGYFFAFNKYYRPKFLTHGVGETWFDSAHNAFLNTLAVQGILGAVSYVLLFALPAIILLLRAKREESDFLKLEYIVFACFFAAHFVHNFFVFEDLTSSLFFFFMLGYVHVLITSEKQATASAGEEKKKAVSQKVTIGPLSGLVMLCVVLLIYTTNINPARANMATVATIRSFQSGNIDTILSSYDQIASYPSPHIDDIRADFARTVGGQAESLRKQNTDEQVEKLVQVAIDALEKNIQLHPLDIRYYLSLAQLDQYATYLTSKLDYVLHAEQIITQAMEYSPQRQQVKYFLSVIKMQLGKTEEAFALIDETIAAEPLVQEGWWRKAAYLKQLGQIGEAKKVIREAEELGVTFHSEGAIIRDAIMELPEILLEPVPESE